MNCVTLPDGRTVEWAVAYPRPEWNDPEHWRTARPADASA